MIFVEIFGLIGFSLIFVNCYVTEWFRFWIVEKNKILARLLTCSMCIGFWAGLIYFLLNGYLIKHSVLLACIVSSGSYLIDSILKVLDGMLWSKLQSESEITNRETSRSAELFESSAEV